MLSTHLRLEEYANCEKCDQKGAKCENVRISFDNWISNLLDFTMGELIDLDTKQSKRDLITSCFNLGEARDKVI
jgi:hypothetical protein